MRNKPLVAVFNHSRDLLETITQCLELEGYPTVHGHLDDVKHGQMDFIGFLRMHDPLVVVLDIAPPLVENLNFFKMIEDLGHMKGRCIIVTTPNLEALKKEDSKLKAHEMLGKPFQIEELIKAIEVACANFRKAA